MAILKLSDGQEITVNKSVKIEEGVIIVDGDVYVQKSGTYTVEHKIG